MEPISARSAPVAISTDPASDLEQLAGRLSPDKVFVLTDKNTAHFCLSLISGFSGVTEDRTLTIEAGDDHKNLESLAEVWKFLSDGGASRHSLLINLGGGMVCDLGGFAAATYKRGISFVNLPTTLLSMVDASVGGKTGINFNGFKNEIGSFCIADMVLLHTPFLNTLDRENLLSGYAEMIKHALIDKPETLERLLDIDPGQISAEYLAALVADSVLVKDYYVAEDPRESGMRKALNLGHTIGHAFESLAMKQGRPVLHGYAVAWGLAAELELAVFKQGFPKDLKDQVKSYILELYGKHGFTSDDFESLYDMMKHDKKNRGARINFTLLSKVGKPEIDVDCTREEIRSPL
ncbi:MAG: 3-dehydroquinate synthase [Marinilabiliaceae bacterium]